MFYSVRFDGATRLLQCIVVALVRSPEYVVATVHTKWVCIVMVALCVGDLLDARCIISKILSTLEGDKVKEYALEAIIEMLFRFFIS